MFKPNDRPKRNAGPPKRPGDAADAARLQQQQQQQQQQRRRSQSSQASPPPPAKAGTQKLKLVGAIAASVSPPPPSPEALRAIEGGTSPLSSLGNSDNEEPQRSSSPAIKRRATQKTPKKPAKPPKPVVVGSRSSKRKLGSVEVDAAAAAQSLAPEPVAEQYVDEPTPPKNKKIKVKLKEPTPEPEEELKPNADLAAELFANDNPQPTPQPTEPPSQPPAPPSPASIAAPLNSPKPPSPPAPTVKSNEKLNPTAEPFKPSPPTTAPAAKPAPAPAAIPAPAARSSIFAAKAGGTPNPLRKKPVTSVFAPKSAARPSGSGAGSSLKPSGSAGDSSNKGTDLFASLVGSGQLHSKSLPPKDSQAEAIARMRVAKKPQMTAEERLADAAKRRIAEREARKADAGNRFDLLEQAIAMNSFEEQYRLEVRKKAKDIVDAEGVRFPLPRLTTYGSVFSIWPSRRPEDQQPEQNVG